MTRYKLQTYQFGIVSGVRQDVSDRITSAVPGNLFAPEARKGHLFVLTESVNESARGKEACDLVANVITSTYYKDGSFSITSSLRNALKAANTTLYEHNFKAAHHQKTAVSLTCAVLRNNDLYIAQVQPTQAYLAHKGQLRALPTYPSWQAGAASPTLMQPNALGTSLFSEPELFRNVAEPGDEIILCSSRLARVLGRSDAERLFCLEDAPSALEELYAIAQRNALSEAHVAVIELLPLVAATVPGLTPEGLAERGKAAASVVGDWLTDVTGNAALMLRRPQAEDAPADGDAQAAPGGSAPGDANDIHPTSALTEPPTLPPALEEIDPRDMNWLRGRPRYRPRATVDTEVWPPSAYLGESSIAPIGAASVAGSALDLSDHGPLPVDFAAIPQRDPVQPPTFGQRLTAPLRHLLAAIVTFFANLGRGRRPSAPPLPRFEHSRGLSYRRTKRRRIPFTSILLLITLVALGYFYIQNRSIQNNESSYQKLLNEASGMFADADRAATDADALKKLDDLETKLAAMNTPDFLADASRKSDYAGLRKDADELRASIERTSLLADLELVATMPTSDTISHLLVAPNGAKNELYFVGNENGILYQQTEGASEQPKIVLKQGSEANGIFVAPVRSVILREDRIVAIDDDQASTIYLSQPDGSWIANRLDRSESWPIQPFPDIETFGGNIYVWEWGKEISGQIRKYASGEYASPPSDWITDMPSEIESQIKDAVDMAIDGRIYLLRPDGTIVIFEAGAYKGSLKAPELNPPLRASRIFVLDERAPNELENIGDLFVIDFINQRIIEISQSGQVVQQLRVPADSATKLDYLTDVVVVPGGPQGRELYIANGNKVYRTPLPAPPPPRQIEPKTGGQASPTPTP